MNNQTLKRSLAGALAILCVAAAAPANMTGAFFPQTAVTASAEELLTEGDFDYRLLDDGTVEIAKLRGDGTEAVVPAEINGAAVTSIGSDAFKNNRNVISVTLPDTITKIGSYAFSGCFALENINIPEGVEVISYEAFACCSSLKEITLPESVKEIGTYAFFLDENLEKINIPKNVTSIGAYTFNSCEKLTEICLPENLEEIGQHAFENCTSLKSFKVAEGNNYFCAFDDVLYSYFDNGLELICCPIAKDSIEFPDNVLRIADSAFRGCLNLTEINIPDTVNRIGAYAFDYCSALTKVSVPEGVKTIYNFTFQYCESLSEVSLPDSLTYIGIASFAYCSSLKSITIPKGVTECKQTAFSHSNDLTELNVDPENKTYYSVDGVMYTKGNDALYRCPTGLTEFEVPEFAKSIGDMAFIYCRKLTSVKIPDTVTEIGDEAFSSCAALKSVVLPDSVTLIGRSVFSDCDELESAVLSGSMTKIPYKTFNFCQKLQKVVIPASITEVADNAFDFCDYLTNVYYGGSKTDWKNNVVIGNYNYKLQRATVHYGCTSPDITKVQYSEQYHQVRINWSPVDDAEQYGIAVFLAGKWRVQTQAIPSSVTSFTTPKNLTPGTSYKIAVAAKIDGKWDIESAVNKAVTVTVK